MNKPIKVQTINGPEGVPLFVVIPYQDYLRWYENSENLIPHEVVGLMVQKQYSPLRAWREYLKLTLADVSKRTGMTEVTLAQLETGEVRLHNRTLRKIADALNLPFGQLNV